ncbi:MAG: hypothetical protein WCJ01_00315, partial [Ignavibacteria bacterium]
GKKTFDDMSCTCRIGKKTLYDPIRKCGLTRLRLYGILCTWPLTRLRLYDILRTWEVCHRKFFLSNDNCRSDKITFPDPFQGVLRYKIILNGYMTNAPFE